MLKVMVRIVADAALVGVLLLIAAGTTHWWQAWVLVGVLLLTRAVGAFVVYRVNPALMHERARLPIHADQRRSDRPLLLGVIATGFLGLPIVAGMDVFRWHARPLPPALVGLGLALFVLGWSLKSFALWENAFAVTVVRLQSERAHAVVDSGPYGVVRHPFYAADPLIFVGSSWWLGSFAASAFAVVPIALMIMRLTLEERFLVRELPGYAAYVAKVRFRLIPGIW